MTPFLNYIEHYCLKYSSIVFFNSTKFSLSIFSPDNFPVPYQLVTQLIKYEWVGGKHERLCKWACPSSSCMHAGISQSSLVFAPSALSLRLWPRIAAVTTLLLPMTLTVYKSSIQTKILVVQYDDMLV